MSAQTRRLLLGHYYTYPLLQISDIFKFLYQSTFGCEHMISSEADAINRIRCEHASLNSPGDAISEKLDGAYSRVHLSWLDRGIDPTTLGKLFFLSAKTEKTGVEALEKKLDVVNELVSLGELPFDKKEFNTTLDFWRAQGYPSLHHSSEFRLAYRPSYRVISDQFVRFLPLFSEIDKRLKKGRLILAIEGGSASGKTTLAQLLRELYDCTVLHMDDFFLRPEQRTPKRFSEIGGNVDRERLLQEVMLPLSQNKKILYSRFDCEKQQLMPPLEIVSKPLTVVEGAYSMHPVLADFYDLSVFLDIGEEYQKERILKRNSPMFAKRFFEEWIPLENAYFSETAIRDRCNICIEISNDRTII